MTPYVANEDSPSPSRLPKPKSIMVKSGKGGEADGIVKPNGDVAVGTPDSVADSRTSEKGTPVGSGKSIIMNGNGKNGKSGILKRVSFGSSKGSMVETLVYEDQDDLAELPPFATPPLVNGDEHSPREPSKVKVTFYECQKPFYVTPPDTPSEVLIDILPPIMASPVPDQQIPTYDRQISSESGIDNPFRPDGELSREADTIVSLIKEGKPITPVKGEPEDAVPATDDHTNGVAEDETDTIPQEVSEELITPTTANAVERAKVGANGSAPKDHSHSSPEPGVVEVQHGVVMPAAADPAQVEQVMIKKKPKCKCCVIQ